MSDHPTPKSRRTLPRWLVSLLSRFLFVAFPVFFVLTGVRFVATETFLRIEYNRPGFPADRFGFSTEDRLYYAPYAVEYLRNDADIDYLGDLTFENGLPLYNTRELRHMEDVKVVTQAAFTIHAILSVLYLGAILILGWPRTTRPALRQALANGGLFTIMLILTLVVLIFANWDFFFDNFHSIFFAGDSWLFSTSDTLIRLFPEQFWFDAAMSIGVFTIFWSLLAILGGFFYGRHNKTDESRED
ncbi:MAG: TIGR01906 family membrane protein [Anaerolineae bacterium]|nr:TIGR01906 family membrane protein [Anaerolineae bacterium]